MANPSTWREVDSAFLTTQGHCSNKSSSPSKPTPPLRSLPSAYTYVTKSAIWKNNPLNPSHLHLAPHFSALLYRKTLQKNSRIVLYVPSSTLLFYSLKTIPNRLSRIYHSLAILFIAFKVNSQSPSDLTSRLRMTWLIFPPLQETLSSMVASKMPHCPGFLLPPQGSFSSLLLFPPRLPDF